MLPFQRAWLRAVFAPDIEIGILSYPSRIGQDVALRLSGRRMPTARNAAI